MITIFVTLTTLIAVASIGIYLGFVKNEGKDERGKAILAKASEISYIFIYLGFAAQALFFLLANPTVNEVQLFITIWMASVFASNGIAIIVFQKKM